jgi:hypothetical protein
MKYLHGVMSGDRVDAHGEAMTLGALRSMVEAVSRNWIPVGVEHDPRIPPLGRVREAELRKEPDGSTSLVGTIELFEPGEAIPLEQPGRRLIPWDRRHTGVSLSWDRAFRDDESQAIIGDIAQALDIEPVQDLKKAVEPIAIITIAAFVAGSIASGFFGEIGADLYRFVKEKLKTLFSSPHGAKEQLFVLRLSIPVGERLLEVEIISTNPTAADLDALFVDGPAQVSALLATPGLLHPTIDRFVCSFRDGSLKLEFAFRQDAVPLSIRTVE